MNHAGEIEPLSRLVRPHVAIVTTIAPVHLEFFGSLEAIADAKAEIFLGLEPGGAAVDQPRQSAIRAACATAPSAPASRASSSFGEHAKADARLIKCALQADCSTVQARILGTDVTYKLGAPGRHLVLNSLPCSRRSSLVGADLALAALALADLTPPTGRGARIALDLPGGARAADRRKLQRQSGLDAGGARAARPGRCRRRAAGASRCSATCWNSGRRAPTCTAAWPSRCVAHGVDLVFCCGPLMHALWEALPSERRGGYAETSAALEPQVLAAIRPGDAVMVKGSLGSRMGPIVKALERHYSARRGARQRADAKADPMLYLALRLFRHVIGRSTCSATSRSAPAAR